MRTLWHDIKAHPFSAALFLIYWLALWGAHWQLRWFGGIPAVGVYLHLLAPAIAGGLVGWWRAPTRKAPSVAGGHLAGGLLAAVLVIELDVALLFGKDGMAGLLQGKWAGVTEWFEGWFLEWLGWSVMIGLLALVPGLIGAYAGATLARVARAGAKQPTAHQDS